MTMFRIFLITFLLVLTIYSVIVVANHGISLFVPFFGAIVDMTWSGQFNLDFMGFLALSGLWVSWRNDFSPAGIGLGVLAFFGGMIFLPIYLLYLLATTNGATATVLLGSRRLAALQKG